MDKTKTPRLSSFILSFLAASIQGIGMYNIHAASGITEGGVLGTVLLLHHWFRISPAYSSLVLNAACYFFGWHTLGKRFLVYSAAAALGYSAGYHFCEQWPPIYPSIAEIPFLAAVFGGLCVGICTGICVRFGGAASGDDALAMSISNRAKIPIQWVYLASDLTVLLLSLSYIPLSRIAYSILTVILSGQIIGWITSVPISKKSGCA